MTQLRHSASCLTLLWLLQCIRCWVSPERTPSALLAIADEVIMKRRDFVAGLMIASAMRHAVAQQPEKTERIALVASLTKVSNMRADKTWFCRAFFEEANRQ
jgi:hypothetical protein